MNSALVFTALVVLNAYYAWRYAIIPIEPDFGIFATWGMTGAAYGRDFVDCKTPLVHMWLLLLSKVKQDIRVVRALHYFMVGSPAILYYALTKDTAGAVAFMVLVHSGWLLAFHGNVGDIPAGLLLIALVNVNPWLSVGLLVLATLYEPKLIVATGLIVLFNYKTDLIPGIVYSSVVGLALLSLWYWKRNTFEWLVESSVIIPKRMVSYRKGLYAFMPGHTSTMLLYIIPWLALGIYSRPEITYWLPPLIFIGFQFAGKIVRPNHLIPVVAWVAAAGLKPEFAYALVSVDWLSAGFYLGNLWKRFYIALSDVVRDAKEVGEWLRDKPGTLWVNTMHAQIYLYAKKPPQYKMMEVIEVNRVAHERRKKMQKLIYSKPPDWIVVGYDVNMEYDYSDYETAAKSMFFRILRRRVT